MGRRTSGRVGRLDAAQVVRRTQQVRQQKTGYVREETQYAITSLSVQQAMAQYLAPYGRGHGTIENRVHYGRDVTWQEDACQSWQGHTQQALAASRNTLTGVLRACGWTTIAQALRHDNAHLEETLRFLGAIT